MAGITDTGFEIKTQTEIRKDITDKLQAAFSIVDANGETTSIDIGPTSRFGQLADIVSDEIESVWEAAQALYDSRYPDNASGINLDNVVAITNTVRQEAVPSNVSCLVLSNNSNVTIPVGQAVAKDLPGDTEQFQNTTEIPIGDNYLCILPDDFADSGKVQLKFQGQIAKDENGTVFDFAFDTPASEWKVFLEGIYITAPSTVEGQPDVLIQAFPEVEVEGSFNTHGYVFIEIVETNLSITKPTFELNTLSKYNVPQPVYAYYSSSEQVTFQGTDTTGQQIPALSVRKVLSSNTNFNSVINPLTGSPGTPRESDAELRIRRREELQNVGQVTPGGIKAKLTNIQGVEDVFLIENDTAFTDADGRPPHSYEVYCNCSEDLEQVVAEAIYQAKPVGIRPVSTQSGSAKVEKTIKDVNGNDLVVEFSRPVGKLFYIWMEVEKTEFYPEDGDQQIKDNLIKYFQTEYELDDTGYNKTVYIHNLFTPVNQVTGIGTLTIKMTTDVPQGDNKDPNQYSFDPIVIEVDNFAYVTEESIVILEKE